MSKNWFITEPFLAGNIRNRESGELNFLRIFVPSCLRGYFFLFVVL